MSYNDAIKLINVAFIKAKTNLFLRHQIRNIRKSIEQTIDQYIRYVEYLDWDCSFEANNNTIQQRLLEAAFTDKLHTYGLARTLENAQIQSNYYNELTKQQDQIDAIVIYETRYEEDNESKNDIKCNNASATSAAILCIVLSSNQMVCIL
ncbi:hypothetical protein GJ496_000834 [Pomphorhynchus laevis]|nr:hypothetical protein GJ496_000834 [Pomphorhynchus laevis]